MPADSDPDGSPASRREANPITGSPRPGSRLELIWDNITSLGLAQAALRLGTHLLSLVLVLAVALALTSLFEVAQPETAAAPQQAAQAAEIPTATPTARPPVLAALPAADELPVSGVRRAALLHTTIPTRARQVVTTYTVQPGDTVFAIAALFNLRPETILWGNYATLADDPHRLRPGQELNILPVDGTYYEWQAGDGLNGVAEFYGVEPETIVNFPGNNLDAAALGDFARPNITPGAWLVIPGGSREFVAWSAPRITRSDPSVAKVLGAGHCGVVTAGPVGAGAFIWPADHHFISGYDYSPAANHYGIDIDGDEGNPIYASDSGVVVYAGWNDWGYGNMIVIDHGNGWQTLYAHLSGLNVDCGSAVAQGNLIGLFGSTGNSTGAHLHFELMHDSYGKVNPWNFLP